MKERRCLWASHGERRARLAFGISLLWVQVECHSGEKTPPILGTAARGQNLRCPLKWKRWVSAQRAQWRCGPRLRGGAAKHSCVTQTCAGDGFFFWKGGLKKRLTEIHPMKVLICWCERSSVWPLLPWLLGNMSLSSSRVSENSTEELLQDRALSIGSPPPPPFIQVLRCLSSFAFSSQWNFQTCNSRGLLFQTDRAQNMERGLQNVYSFLDHH